MNLAEVLAAEVPDNIGHHLHMSSTECSIITSSAPSSSYVGGYMMPMEPYGSNGALWGIMGPYGTIWNDMGPKGPGHAGAIWVYLIPHHSVCFCSCLGSKHQPAGRRSRPGMLFPQTITFCRNGYDSHSSEDKPAQSSAWLGSCMVLRCLAP